MQRFANVENSCSLQKHLRSCADNLDVDMPCAYFNFSCTRLTYYQSPKKIILGGKIQHITQ